ncbi:MAG: hypothetical protein OWU84_14025 [Firmicutes bacterium]|nr:hypothetical protein [Bacillota bacterium]
MPVEVSATLDVSSEGLGLPYNVRLDGGASGSGAYTTGQITAASRVLTLADPIDFKDGQGIFIPHAGPLSSLSPPKAPTVSQNGPRGNDRYSYVVVALDGLGGGSAASAPATLTTGPAALGGLGPDGSGENSVLYEARWVNLEIEPVPGALGGYAVYRVEAPASSQLALGFLGIVAAIDAPFLDYGQDVSVPPPGIPAAPPSQPFAQGLVTRIVSGGGTRVLTLADAAVTAVADGDVFHDDTHALQRAYQSGATRFYHPAGTYRVSQPLAFDREHGVLAGDGPSSILCCQGSQAASLVVAASGVRVAHLAIEGQFLATTLLTIDGADDVTVHGVTLRDALGAGVNARAVGESPARRLALGQNRVQNCPAALSILGQWDGVLVSENVVDFDDYNAAGRGVSLHNLVMDGSARYPIHWVVSQNRIRAGNHTGGIVVQGAGLGVITSNVLTVAGGIFGFAFYGDPGSPASSSGVVCSANYCESLWSGTGNAFYLNSYDHVTVSDNVVRNWGYALEAVGYEGVTAAGVLVARNNIENAVLGAVDGTLPSAVHAEANSGLNPLGLTTENPPVADTPYQNPYPAAICVYQPVACVDPSAEAVVEVAVGISAARLTSLYRTIVPTLATPDSPWVATVSVPHGWWYRWTVTNAVLLAPVIAVS